MATTTITATTAYGSESLTVDMPALTGSDKQVAWAQTLRKTAIEETLDKLVESPRAVKAWASDPRRERFLAALAAEVVSHVDSKWWIDNRGSRALAQAAVRSISA